MLINKSRVILASLSGILLGVSLSDIGLWWCAWFSIVPLFIALRGLPWKQAFVIGFITGSVHFSILVNWLAFILLVYTEMHVWQSFILFVIFLLYLSIYLAIFSVVISCMVKHPWQLFFIAPSSWVVLEFLRGWLLTGFPWGYIGYSQFEHLYIIQISDIFGIYGVSFIILLFNAIIYILFLFLFGRSLSNIVITIKMILQYGFYVSLILAFVLAYGYWRILDVKKQLFSSALLKIGIVQGNIDQSTKWNPMFQIDTTKKYVRLSELLSSSNLDLIVWPETATPFCFGQSPKLTAFVIDSIRNIDCDFIIGSPTLLDKTKFNSQQYYNSAYLVGSKGIINGRYDKAHLVPFGEYFPFKKLSFMFPCYRDQLNDFQPGSLGKVLEWKSKNIKLGVQICYEIVFPMLSRSMVINNAGILLNLTNDAWMGNTSGSSQHFSMSVFRAIENRRSLVRAANTGISSFVSPTGEILSRTKTFKDEILVGEIPILVSKTIYNKLGNSFVLFCMLVPIVVCSAISKSSRV